MLTFIIESNKIFGPDTNKQTTFILCADDNSQMNAVWDVDPTQSWDGVDGATSLLDAGALSSLPYGDAEVAEAAAVSDGLPTYRGGKSKHSAVTGIPVVSGAGSGNGYGGISPVLPTSRAFRKPGSQTAEEAALEDYLVERAVDEGMALHHARLENAHNRYSISVAFGEILEEIEQEDVWRNAEPLLPGTELRMPTWIRASEAMEPLLDDLNEATRLYEIEQTEINIQEAEDHILDQVESARKLLSLTDPKAGLSVEPEGMEGDALDELFGDGDTLLPGASSLLEGEEEEIRKLAEGKENSIMNSLLEEILPEVGGYALDYADLMGENIGGNPGMIAGALQQLTNEVDSVLEEKMQAEQGSSDDHNAENSDAEEEEGIEEEEEESTDESA